MLRQRMLVALVLASTVAPFVVSNAHADGRQSYVERRADERRNTRGDRIDEQAEVADQFPNATRESPEGKASGRYGAKLNQMIEQLNEGEAEKALATAEEVIAAERATPYDKAVAYQIAGNAAYELEDMAKAIEYLQKAIESNALDNNAHFITMQNVASFQVMEDQNADAVTTLNRMIAESGTQKPDVFAMLAGAQYAAEDSAAAAASMRRAMELAAAQGVEAKDDWTRLLYAAYVDLDQPEEALKLSEQMYQKNPTDKRLLLSLASAYQDAGQDDRAVALFQKARSEGLLTEARDYQVVYTTYYNMDGHEADVIGTIEEGLAKGALPRDLQTLSVLAQAYYFTDNMAKAVEYYTAAAALDPKGDTELNLAKILVGEERDADAKAAAQRALAKGLAKPGDAWMVIASAESGLGNNAAMIAAYREAAKFPETAQQAQQWLSRNAR